MSESSHKEAVDFVGWVRDFDYAAISELNPTRTRVLNISRLHASLNCPFQLASHVVLLVRHLISADGWVV